MRRRRGIAVVIGLHALLAWALLSGTAQKTIEILKKPLEAVVIQEVIIPPAPPPPQPKEIRALEPLAPKMASPLPIMQADVPLPSLSRPLETTTEAPPLPAKPAVVTPTATVQAPPPVDNAKAQAASMESEYVGKVRTILNLTKRYPTGRQASQQRPQGRVKVWFTLTRSGTLLDVGVLESSNSNLLDDAALSSVRRGTYPPFPDHTWLGQEHHKFSADIEFAPPSAG
jgi:protein TonB